MKKLAIIIIIVLTPASVLASKYSCKEHEYYLSLKSAGFEHVNHKLLLNGKVLIKELEESMWFIESVKCNKKGFNIIASHIQYNDPTKKEFLLVIKNSENYEIN